MKSFWKITFASLTGTILASFVMFFLMLIILFGIVNSAKNSDEAEIESQSILKLDFDTKIVDRASDNPLEDFDFATMNPNKSVGLNKILENISKAKADEKIEGIYLELKGLDAGISTITEIRNALLDFKESGKFIISYSNYYSQATYFLASVSDKIYLNPEGGLDFVGLSAQLMFFKNAFDKFGIKPMIIRHGKFKSAVEPFMLDKMSEANREQVQKYVGSIWNSILNGISKERHINIQELNKFADNLIIKDANSALENGLIDEIKYYDEIEKILKVESKIKKDKKLKFVSLSKYNKVPKKKEEGEKGLAKDKIAVIYAQGEIVMGEGSDGNIGGDGLAKTIRKARNDEKIKAIVLRINSPGGSALASEIIWREVVLAKQEKPVIVSMGDVAASGGYYIACAADSILASENTITGSIGVFGVLFNIKELLNNKIGITTDKVNTNKHSDIGSTFRNMEIEEEAYIQQMIEKIYSTFINHVADGRGMTAEEVDAIGQGRVWSGENALKNGLVDKIGGLNDAIKIAAEKAKLNKYRIIEMPKKKEAFEKIIEDLKNMKVNYIKSELGELENFYIMYQSLSNMKGIQARLPLEIEIH
ncbi:MAG: signal peptide peptidase SppA [Bacteroidales bacterium]|nr:signal peptide peptidase SppA [Bacteroidales bacterium]MBN2757007.1 signal peptide peptidase SppA [Bacteroidales bacterium]